jgi:hypothetical protein
MNRLALLVLALLVTAAPAARAQGTSPLIRYGKWVLAAGAVGMNYLADRAHDRADNQFDILRSRCFDNRDLCALDAAGRYSDAGTEELYQSSLRYDGHARRWLFAGETALVGAAAMFVYELTRHAPKPDNIPFEPEVRSLRQATGVGVRIGF